MQLSVDTFTRTRQCSTTTVPDLVEDDGALFVHGIRDGLPCLHLLLVVDAWSNVMCRVMTRVWHPRPTWDIKVPIAHRTDNGALGDEQSPITGALRIVCLHVGLGDVAHRPVPGEGRQHDAVLQRVLSNLHGGEERIGAGAVARRGRGAVVMVDHHR